MSDAMIEEPPAAAAPAEEAAAPAEEPAAEKEEAAAEKEEAAAAPAAAEEEDDEDEDDEAPAAKNVFAETRVTGKRERKKVERIVVTAPEKVVKEFSVEPGKGTPLGEIDNVAFHIDKTKSDELTVLYRLCFGRPGKASTRKKHLRQFSGLAEDRKVEKVTDALEKIPIAGLKRHLTTCDLPLGGSKGDLIERLTAFLEAPAASGKKSLAEEKEEKKEKAAKKRERAEKSKENRKKKAAKKKAVKEKAASKKRKKKQQEEEEEEDSDEEESEEEESEEEESEEEEKPKKKPAKKKQKKVVESSDDEDDDVPLGQLKKQALPDITKEWLLEKIKEIVDKEGFDTLTLKLIRAKLSKESGGQDMSEHKALIKELVTEGDF